MNSVFIFQDHEDYVRSIDYSKHLGRLFSASDDGKVFLWDLHAEKLMQKYQNYDETGYINGAPAEGNNRRARNIE